MKWYMKWITNVYWTADMKPSEAMIVAVMNATFAIALRRLKNSRLQQNNDQHPTSVASCSSVGLEHCMHIPRAQVQPPVEVLNFSGFSMQLQKLHS